MVAYDALFHSLRDANIYWIDLDGDSGCRFVRGQLYVHGEPIGLHQLFVLGIQAYTSSLHLGVWIFECG